MKITKPGLYRLTADWSTRGNWSMTNYKAGDVIEVSQIDSGSCKVICPKFLDWADNDIPAEPVKEATK